MFYTVSLIVRECGLRHACESSPRSSQPRSSPALHFLQRLGELTERLNYWNTILINMSIVVGINESFAAAGVVCNWARNFGSEPFSDPEEFLLQSKCTRSGSAKRGVRKY